MSRNARTYTNEELDMICDTSKTATEIAEFLKIHPMTVFRKRSELGINIRPGAKKGKPAPNRVTKYKKVCMADGCEKEFETVPSADKKFCSRSCNARHYMLINNPNKPGVPKPWLIKEDVPAYTRYKRKVHNLSHKIYEENIELINPNRYPRTVNGVTGGWQLDHIKSIRECFDEGISIEGCAKLENLQLLPWQQNLEKR